MSGIVCTKCDKNLRQCQCPDITERLKTIIGAPNSRVYIGNIITERIDAGLNKLDDFAGLNIYAPFQSPLGVAMAPTLDEIVNR